MMKDCFTNMETGISYKRRGDYYLPDMALPPKKEVQLNRYGRARLAISKSIGEFCMLICSRPASSRITLLRSKIKR